MLQWSKGSARSFVVLKKGNTKKFHMRAFEDDKDRYCWNRIVDYRFPNIFDQKFTFMQHFPGTLGLHSIVVLWQRSAAPCKDTVYTELLSTE